MPQTLHVTGPGGIPIPAQGDREGRLVVSPSSTPSSFGITRRALLFARDNTLMLLMNAELAIIIYLLASQ